MQSVAITGKAALPQAVVVPERDRTIADMQAFLARVRPATPSESLRLLRNAYPHAPLSLRVAACGIA